METLHLLGQGFAVAFQPLNLGLALLGAFAGTIVGALPGLGPANGVAILIPVSFTLGLAPESALICWRASTTAPCTAAASPASCSTSRATSQP